MRQLQSERQLNAQAFMRAAGEKVSHIKPGPPKRQIPFYTEWFSDCWKAFDQFLGHEYKINRIDKRIEQFEEDFKNEYDQLYKTGAGPNFLSSIELLTKYSIPDKRPNPKNGPISIKKKDDIRDIVDFIYALRCALDHGSLSPRDPNYLNILIPACYVSYHFLHKLVEPKLIVR